jgi:CO/xanthine dehydrogenase Mo-binding subunit
VPYNKDLPDTKEVYILEKPKEYRVYGSHGHGEPPKGPPRPTHAKAVHNAIGIWFDELPITRTRLTAAVKQSA